ncbi:MAG TPA: hypothetical protein PLM07_05800 [Candidatus Rifleibacterium sp.]|nr:hypothetical protein [Candidatus Rifleibacterium sp.]HPT45397.1 hypothetical protein [Candidatus Rifleibacterium sp.]
MFRKFIIGFLVEVFCVGLVCFAAAPASDSRFLQVISGEYRFRLLVLASGTHYEIHNATATISLYKKTATIEVFAPGYCSNIQTFKLLAGKFYYEGSIYLYNPTIFTFVRDYRLKQLNGTSWPEWEPCNNCWYDEICVAGEFFKAGFETISVDDFHAHINWTHEYAFPPRVFLFDLGEKWGFEIIIDRSALKPNKSNHIDIIITRNGEHNQPQGKQVQRLAWQYLDALAAMKKVAHESDYLRIHDKLAAIARKIIRDYEALSDDEQIEILAILPGDIPLSRSLNNIRTFASLHNN